MAAAGADAAKMFFHLIMPAEVELHPRHFGPTMRNTLEQKLTREVHNQPPSRWLHTRRMHAWQHAPLPAYAGCRQQHPKHPCDQDRGLISDELTAMGSIAAADPTQYRGRLLAQLQHTARSQVEGTCSGKYGFVVAVTGIIDISKASVLCTPARGSACRNMQPAPCSQPRNTVHHAAAADTIPLIRSDATPSSTCRARYGKARALRNLM